MEAIFETDMDEQQVLEKSGELFMRYGIRSVSMDDIARTLGISKKTLYQLVDNKADLIRRIYTEQMQCEESEMVAIRQRATDAIDEILQVGLYVIRELRLISPTTVYDMKKYYADIYREVEQTHASFLYEFIHTNLEHGMKQGLYRSNLNPDIVTKLFVGKSTLVGDDAHFPSDTYSLEELFKQHLKYHIYGVASPQGQALLHKHLETTFREIN